MTDTDELTIDEQLWIRESYCVHMESCVEVLDELENPQRGVPANVLQERIERAIKICERRGQPARLIILKGRRSGCSTICSKVVDLECRNQRARALQIADSYDRTDEIFNMTARFAASDEFPWGFGAEKKAKVLLYGNGSEVKKATALDRNAGRGGQRRVIHASEVAHFRTGGVQDGGKMLLGLLPSVAKLVGTIVLAESTPNGQTGWFYETWCSAQWLEEDDYWKKWDATAGSATQDDDGNLWVRVFAAWFEIPKYSLPVTAEEADRILRTLSPREQQGRKRYGWTPEQIKWRRTTIKTDCKSDERLFDQEFPEDPQSCFLASGMGCFSREALDRIQADCDAAAPLWRYGVLEAPDGDEGGVIFRETPMQAAWMKVIEEPRVNCHYILPCDTMRGVDQSDAGNDPDAHSLAVLRRGYVSEESRNEPARAHPTRLVARVLPPSRCSAKALVYMAEMLSRWYGGALFVPESNQGLHVIERAKDRPKLPIYSRTEIRRERDVQTDLLGWFTEEQNRRQIVETLQEKVHATEPVLLVIECPHLLGQMRTFVKNKEGKYEAAPNCHDDDVMMLGIGLQTLGSAHRMRERPRLRKRRRGDYW